MVINGIGVTRHQLGSARQPHGGSVGVSSWRNASASAQWPAFLQWRSIAGISVAASAAHQLAGAVSAAWRRGCRSWQRQRIMARSCGVARVSPLYHRSALYVAAPSCFQQPSPSTLKGTTACICCLLLAPSALPGNNLKINVVTAK